MGAFVSMVLTAWFECVHVDGADSCSFLIDMLMMSVVLIAVAEMAVRLQDRHFV